MRIKHTIYAVRAFRLSVFVGFLTLSCFNLTHSASGNLPELSQAPDLINWIMGPAKADLGDVAEIDVPPGYRFASGAEAAIVLRTMNNPAPETLVGLLAPSSGNYVVIFEYTPTGYIKTKAREKIDTDAALTSVRNYFSQKIAASGKTIGAVEWQRAPKYDRSRNQLEWAILAEIGSRKTVNHVVRQLGREGLLDGIAVQSGQSSAVPLKQLMAGVSFKPGYAYTDYQEGDTIAKHRLGDLMASEPPAEQIAKAFPYQWTMFGGAGLVAVAGGILIIKRRTRWLPSFKHTNAPAAGRLNSSTPKSPAPAKLNQMDRSNEKNGTGNHNGNGNGTGNAHSHGKMRRKRVFDYQRFYSDLMFQVSDNACETTFTRSQPLRRAPASETTEPLRSASVDNVSLAANLGLIEAQKRLIEEQQRLIREQTKVIEEKTRLIQEKNQVLDKQVELFGNNIF